MVARGESPNLTKSLRASSVVDAADPNARDGGRGRARRRLQPRGGEGSSARRADHGRLGAIWPPSGGCCSRRGNAARSPARPLPRGGARFGAMIFGQAALATEVRMVVRATAARSCRRSPGCPGGPPRSRAIVLRVTGARWPLGHARPATRLPPPTVGRYRSANDLAANPFSGWSMRPWDPRRFGDGRRRQSQGRMDPQVPQG